MVSKSIIGATCTCLAVVSLQANAALAPRLGGLAYYDDVADLTWLADANAAVGSAYDTYNPGSGLMNWSDANAWAASLVVDSVGGWRLPDTLQPDASCQYQISGVSNGDNCTGSEMGNLFYNVLGNTAGSLTNTASFSNVQSNGYWSATEFAPSSITAWYFDMRNGFQDYDLKPNGLSAWAVQSGDVSAARVPVPAAAWLFGSGLIGLIGIAKRKKAA